MIDTILLVVGLLIAVKFVGVLPIALILGGLYAAQTIGIFNLFILIVVAFFILYACLTIYRRSSKKGFVDLLAIILLIIGWGLSRFATVVRRLGSILSFMSMMKSSLGLYLGQGFVQKRREEFIELGVGRVERGDVEVTDPPEKLVEEAREAYNNAGLRLSNGEAVLGIGLAAVTLLPASSVSVPFSGLMTATWVSGGLAIALVFAVSLRLTAFEMVLIKEPQESQGAAKLMVIRDWNRAMSGGTELVKSLLFLKFIHNISEEAYKFYIDWIFAKNYDGDGAGRLELLRDLRRPLFAFQSAEWMGVSPVEASQSRYGWNVFAPFDFGPGADYELEEKPKEDALDWFLNSLIDIKNNIKNSVRHQRVLYLATQKEASPEKISQRLYGENIYRDEQNTDKIDNRKDDSKSTDET